MSAQPSIALPRWYARFAFPGHHSAPPESHDGPRRVGPFTIHRAQDGCQVATHGDPADPVVVLFDGYLFDRIAMRRELGLPGDATDAVIAAAGYQSWGSGVLDRLDGSYLVCIWDPRESRLILGHDALGHHPVFYSKSDDAFWFGSNVLALTAKGAVRPDPNRVSLALAALTQWPAAGQTFFEDVQRLRPGHYLSVSANLKTTEHTYWSPWLSDDDPGLTEQQAWDQFEPTLVGAIDRCMELAPDGIMLSGGLDSVTIAALAADYARQHGSPLICAVSGRRDYPPSDEEPMQTAVATALQMRHITARESQWLHGRSLVDLSLEAASELPGPSRIYWVGGYMSFYRYAAQQGVRVALTGSGGDNWVSVADAFSADAMRKLQFGAVIRHMRSWMGTGGLSFKSAAHHLLWSGGLRLLLDSYSAKYLSGAKRRYHAHRAASALPAWLCPDPKLREAVADSLHSQRPSSLASDGRIPPNLYRHTQRAATNPYYQYEFEVGFHVEAQCGLRLLSPYHDKRVVRFLNSIPPHVLLHGENYKGMLRPVAERRLPNLGLGAQRKIYETDVRRAQYHELRSGVAQAWPRHDLKKLAELDVIDVTAVSQAMTPTDASRALDFVSMYALMSADRWLGARASPREDAP